MNTNPLKQGALTENSAGIGTVTRKMVRQRAIELSLINGRSAQEVSTSDWEQGQLELTGNSDTESKEAVLESAAGSISPTSELRPIGFMSRITSREIRLASRPHGLPTVDNFILAQIGLGPLRRGGARPQSLQVGGPVHARSHERREIVYAVF